MRPRAVVLALGALLACIAAVTGAAADPARTPPSRLVPFDGCRSFAAYMRSHAVPLVGRPDLGAIAVPAQPGAARGNVSGSPGASAPEVSGTNVQEEGVDEPDMVKTDGRYLYVASAGGVSALDLRSGQPKLVDTVALASGAAYELLLDGDRLLALSREVRVPVPPRTTAIGPILPAPVESTMTEIDVADPTRMRVVRTLELDGSYLTARLVGSTARVVVSSTPITVLPLPSEGAGSAAARKARERNRRIVESAGAASWLPRYTLRDAHGDVVRKGRLVDCRDVLRPRAFSGLGLVTVLTVDLARGLPPVDSDAVAADARIVYATSSSLYVATSQPPGVTPRGVVARGGTTIHKLDISSPTQTRYVASGQVPGVLLDQWSLSERDGVLRVASMSVPLLTGGADTESETSITMLTQRGGSLTVLGRVGGLGRGERVYAVRYVGEVGYVVTFREVDPLYTVDLSVPSRPAIRGELKIRGYSAYLHPVGEGLLLGIGQDATEDGRLLGTLASLFDVSDPAHPRRLDAFTLGQARSQAEQDHHAFLWWPRSRLAVIPIQAYVDRAFVGALVLRVRRSGISEAGRLVHPGVPGVEPVGSPGTPISRSLVVDDTLYTISAAGVKASALGTFADRGFVRLPFGEARPKPVPSPAPRR